MPRKFPFVAAFAVVFAFAAYCHFYRIDWGLPSREKTLQIFRSLDEVQSLTPAMLELRDRYYQGIDQMLDPNSSMDQIRDRLFYAYKKLPPLAELPREQVLDRARSYLIGVVNQEEQNALYAVSNMNPLKLDFNPGVYTVYGGFYYYTLGAALAAGKVARMISLTPDIRHYFLHPEETRRMYMLMRAVGALSVLALLALLFFWMLREEDGWIALLSAVFLALTPLLVPHSHRVGAHNYATFLFMLGLFFCWRFVKKPEWTNYLLAGGVLGLSAGCIITNLTVGIAIFFAECFRCEWNLKKVFTSVRFYAACAVFFAVYLATNYYLYVDFASFQRAVQAMQDYMAGYGQSYGTIQLHRWIPFLKDMFSNQLHWSVAPLILLGIPTAWVSRRPVLRYFVVVFLFSFGLNLLLTRHPGVNIRTFPLVAVFCAAACHSIATHRSILFQFFGGIAIGAALILSGLQTFFYARILARDSLMEGGRWVNENIPAGSEIGVVGGQIVQIAYPPIRFLEYRMIHFPTAQAQGDFPAEKLPQYVVWDSDAHPLLKDYYETMQEWRQPRRFLGVPFGTYWVATAHNDLFIFKKVKP